MSRQFLVILKFVFLSAGCVPVTEPVGSIEKAEPNKDLIGTWRDEEKEPALWIVDRPDVKGNPKGLMRLRLLEKGKSIEDLQPKDAVWFFTTSVSRNTYANALVLSNKPKKVGREPDLAREGGYAEWARHDQRGYWVGHLTIKGPVLTTDPGDHLAFEALMMKQKFMEVGEFYKTTPGWLTAYLEKNGPERDLQFRERKEHPDPRGREEVTPVTPRPSGRSAPAGTGSPPASAGAGPRGRSLALPRVGMQGVKHALGQFQRVAAVAAGHARSAARAHAIEEVLQLGRELVALAVAVQVQHLQVAAEDLVLQPRLRAAGSSARPAARSGAPPRSAAPASACASRSRCPRSPPAPRRAAGASGCRVMRLAVTCATQPLANSSRAFTMSSCPPNTAAPTADTFFTGAPTSESNRSRSWIIRSSTAPMSIERPVNGPCRSASMNLARIGRFRSSSNAGLNRSMCPTWSGTPADRPARSVRPPRPPCGRPASRPAPARRP